MGDALITPPKRKVKKEENSHQRARWHRNRQNRYVAVISPPSSRPMRKGWAAVACCAQGVMYSKRVLIQSTAPSRNTHRSIC